MTLTANQKYGAHYGALFNASYVPNKLEAIYIKDPAWALGPFFIAGILDYFLFGVILMQIGHYFRTYKLDSRIQKFHVCFLALVITLKSSQILAALWKREAVDWGNFYELTQIEEASKIAAMTTSFVTTVVQVFFIHRCFRLSNRNYFFAIPASMGVLLNLAAAIWMGIVMPTNFANKKPDFNVASKVFPISSVVTDAIITLTTLYTLIRVRRKAISNKSITMVSRLLRLTLETAFPPLITAVCNASFTGQLNGPLVFCFLSTTPYLQAFSMMYTINLRADIRDAAAPSTYRATSDLENGMSLKQRVNHQGSGTDAITLQNVSVNVTKYTDSKMDPDSLGEGSTW